MSKMGIQRPTGVAILAILSFLGGLFGILGFTYYTILSFVLLLINVASLATGWGLWNLRDWAHPLALILQVVSMIMDPLNLIAGSVDFGAGTIFTSMVIGWIISAIIIYYLTRPEIKEVFGVTDDFMAPLRKLRGEI